LLYRIGKQKYAYRSSERNGIKCVTDVLAKSIMWGPLSESKPNSPLVVLAPAAEVCVKMKLQKAGAVTAPTKPNSSKLTQLELFKV